MSTFRESPELYKQIDYKIVRNGCFLFYRSSGELGNDLMQLDKSGYTIAEFNCHGISNLLEQFNKQFHFAPYFRNNLDALNDCIEDIEINGTGLVIALKNLDNLKKDDSEMLLEILVNRAQMNFIIGKRLLILAHSNNAVFRLEPLKIICIEP
jgi:RNAse (barnase) inhibitor barstar